MKSTPPATAQTVARSMALGILFSMLFLYSVHVLGTWQIENYRPDPETTSTVLLHNTCAIFGTIHTLRPNTDVSAMGEGIDATKLSGSFMNFTDGHLIAMIIISLLAGGAIFAFRYRQNSKRQLKAGS